MKYKYIRNNPLYGLEYDYEFINKQFRKMLKDCKAPSGLYDPTSIPWNDSKWFTLMSERSASKTTQIILYLLVIFKYYGSRFAIARTFKTQITKSMYSELFNIIKSRKYKYIEWLTDNKCNDIQVDRESKKCTFCHVDDETLAIDYLQDKSFCYLVSVAQADRYTSNFNTEDLDFLFFDEYTRDYFTGEFIDFNNMIATFRRARESFKIVLATNTIDPYHPFMKELSISSTIARFKKGSKAIITAPLGAKVYAEMLDVEMHNTTEFKASNLEYYGFANEGLRAIYGGEWEISLFRHLPRLDYKLDFKNINIHFRYMGQFLKAQTFRDKKQVGVFISPTSYQYNDNIPIITDEPSYNIERREYTAIDICNKIIDIDNKGLLYFADNETALQFYSLLEAVTGRKKKR